MRAEPEGQKAREVATEVAGLPKLRFMTLTALDATTRDDGWSTLSALGSKATRNHPSFDSCNYGVSKLGELMRKQAYLKVRKCIRARAPRKCICGARRDGIEGSD